MYRLLSTIINVSTIIQVSMIPKFSTTSHIDMIAIKGQNTSNNACEKQNVYFMG